MCLRLIWLKFFGNGIVIKGSEVRKADHLIEKLLLDRWSPRAMSGEEISQEELMRLFEAARWAPSSFNTQQWRALYAHRGTEHWQTFFDLLVDANKAWAKNAAVLVVFISRRNFDHNDEPSVTHSYDCEAAWENFALQGFYQGSGCAWDARIRLRSGGQGT
jgi:nitroreductase